jgi:hypothetical protein
MCQYFNLSAGFVKPKSRFFGTCSAARSSDAAEAAVARQIIEVCDPSLASRRRSSNDCHHAI